MPLQRDPERCKRVLFGKNICTASATYVYRLQVYLCAARTAGMAHGAIKALNANAMFNAWTGNPIFVWPDGCYVKEKVLKSKGNVLYPEV